MRSITQYFPNLTPQQAEQFAQLGELYRYWNERINLISRKDIELLYERHVLHSLAIAKACTFAPGARILDVGTGGGFPGIPLAIMFPQCRFMLVDSIGKKIMVVSEVAKALALQNVTALQARAETLPQHFDFVVSRAVTDLPTFMGWVWSKIARGGSSSLPNGILYLKGGDLSEELKPIKQPLTITPLSDFFSEEFFETKKVVYVAK
ncbi:MAG: 16S rRNA (guanine(527)-N(7))-methyltransferase RsmG [Prevotellaceae bacterium]|jgi:16S rRNA (guanine527-N7)-methyltransferase|nr:16S rRNA (guanine(527)-N(7))-methyltransferase RsmG [Prevotellaceae bacterium]